MDNNDIRRLSEQTGIAAETIARWHLIEAPRRTHSHAGRPKGKPKRPQGMLSLGDACQKYNLKPATLKHWRNAGLKIRSADGMILVRESELLRYMRKAAD